MAMWFVHRIFMRRSPAESIELVTQIFLPGDVRNQSDRWYRAVAHPERLVPKVVRDDVNGLHLHWTVFIAQA